MGNSLAGKGEKAGPTKGRNTEERQERASRLLVRKEKRSHLENPVNKLV